MLITQSKTSSKPEVERLIQNLLEEGAQYDHDLRSAHRESLVSPVSISLTDKDLEIAGFSRDVSVSGICVLCDTEVIAGERATLEIYRLHSSDPSRLLAECRWCKPFGDDYFASGWEFSSLALD